jgi:hypothetical protein
MTCALSIHMLCVPGLACLSFKIIGNFDIGSVIVWYLFAVRFGAFLFVEPELYQISLTGSSGIMVSLHRPASICLTGTNQRAAIGLYVQAYFCSRLFLLSKKWYIVTPLASVFVTTFIANVVGVRICLHPS